MASMESEIDLQYCAGFIAWFVSVFEVENFSGVRMAGREANRIK
jgi:hypothetical protein